MRRKKILTIIGLVALVAMISAFTTSVQEDKPRPINLKVLPKNISNEDLEATMKSYNLALGVKCNHCHAPKSNGEQGLDFASDANHLKEVARHMIKMNNQINKKYFSKHERDGVFQQIGCNTCHNGAAEPKTIAVLK